MYNTITEQKIKQIPQIGDIDINRLPQELTRIYAIIVTLRNQINKERTIIENKDILEGIELSLKLANNLETILLLNPDHLQKESIAFVAATAHQLIYRASQIVGFDSKIILGIDSISSVISSIILFLIGNSQTDAAEMASKPLTLNNQTYSTKLLVSYLQNLGKGRLKDIIDNPFNEHNLFSNSLEELALEYLWKEVGNGIYNMALMLTGDERYNKEVNYFDKVIRLSTNEDNNKIKSIYNGPYHLSKLLKLFESDIKEKALINVPSPVGVDSSIWFSFLKNLSIQRPFLWENHIEAVQSNFLNSGVSAVLTLPTGAGKSTLSELKIASCIYSGYKAIYLVPTHALEDQVKNNLKIIFSEFSLNDNIIDGEYTEIVDINIFPILVMTPERCLTVINTNDSFLKDIKLVVFDEFHLINGRANKFDRRSFDAMFCLINLLTYANHSDFLLISAMVENGNEIKEWLNLVLKRDCILFESSWKPTRQLRGCILYKNEEIVKLNKIKSEEKKSGMSYASKKLKEKLAISPCCLYSLKNVWDTIDNNDYFISEFTDINTVLGLNKFWKLTANRNEVAAILATHFSKIGLKTLIFVDTPKNAVSTAKKIDKTIKNKPSNISSFFNPEEGPYKSLILELGDEKYSYINNFDNVGVHHGLLLPLERSLIEEYFKNKEGYKIIVATATLAQGINLPAEIVIIAGDDRYDEYTNLRESIPPHELLNAAGRAGRAGQSAQGVVLLIPGSLVLIDGSEISNNWWKLKNDVFSKSDQCLTINDPLEYFLDSIYRNDYQYSSDLLNLLFRFKVESMPEIETKNLLENSLFVYRNNISNKSNLSDSYITSLIDARNLLDSLTIGFDWVNEISFKSGVDPDVVYRLSHYIDIEIFDEFINLSVEKLINWLFQCFKNDKVIFKNIFYKKNTLIQINKVLGINVEEHDFDDTASKLSLLETLIIEYINGTPLNLIDELIPGKNDLYLTKSRNFVSRLIPDLSFIFGVITLIVLEKAKQKNIHKTQIPLNLRCLSSCIREGFNNVEILKFKYNKNILSRVETHKLYKNI